MRVEQRLILLMAVLVVAVRVLAGLEADRRRAPSDAATAATASRLARFAPSEGTVLLEDDFEGPDGVITSNEHYEAAHFPLRGASRPSNPSPLWECESGWFFRSGGWGYSGRPADWANRFFFRINSRSFAIGDARITWGYRSAKFGDGGYPTRPTDAADLWLRLRSQYDLYVFQFDRQNDGVVAKRKVPAQGWSGPATLLANRGVYYTIPTDEAQPVLGPGKQLVPWSAVQDRLPASERAKPGFPNLAHDATTEYDFAVVIRNLPGGKVRIQGYRAGVLVFSATDDGRSGIAANGDTQGEHVDKGYFASVPGWQSAWAAPITEPGAIGLRADNLQLWISHVRVTALEASESASAEPAESGAAGAARDAPATRPTPTDATLESEGDPNEEE